MTQNNLGTALSTLGEREAGTARLEEAVAAFRAALEEYTRDRTPLQWAYTQHGLTNATALLAVRLNDPARMNDALTCVRNAAAIYQEGQVSHWLRVAEQQIAEIEAQLVGMHKSGSSRRRGDEAEVFNSNA